MSTNTARVIPFPQPQPETAEELARKVLAAKRAIAEAEALIKELSPRLIAIMQAEDARGVSVAGAGRVSLVVSEGGSRLDQRAAVAALISAGLEVPMAPTAGGVTLRAALD